jgi:transcriptional regulator with XRE-family HTH domain
MMETKKFLGARIQEIRKHYNLKQSQLAEIVCIDSKHMSKIECGRCYPSFELLDKIARALNVTPAEFLKIEHLQEKKTLLKEMNDLLDKADEEKVRICYKLIKDILSE